MAASRYCAGPTATAAMAVPQMPTKWMERTCAENIVRALNHEVAQHGKAAAKGLWRAPA
jgi:hypothetical protein